MPLRRVFLRFPKCADIIVRSGAARTFRLLAVRLVQTTLMEGMLAQEVNSGQIQASAAGGTATCLEDGGFVAQVVHLLAFGFGFGAITFD